MAFLNIRNSYAARHPLRGVLVNLLLLLACAFLILGLKLPLVSIEKLWFFGNTVSLLSAISQLWQGGEKSLAVLIGSFSLLFPVIKLLLLFYIWNLEDASSPGHGKHLKWLNTYSKWSMLDVFVVALLVVTLKLGMLAKAQVEFGLYAFAASVILTMLLSAWMGQHTGDN
ncbi:paraquat-inducible protein A [Thiolapillus brandeum]|uniref:Paraquat-inducible protein A n=1 Tax=Thiolapillus brandeum TaxID=1076588 RepID=A0A7U6GI66_9GAMM|nr:paraquat-inducible protein A [Thiolapillus brandeum]BAO44096.1 paraquat-inducible protein A [Thiolapillus brandeum]